MSGSKLDQIVKGAPPPGTLVSSVSSRSPSPNSSSDRGDNRNTASKRQWHSSDPLAALPSSPPQIYLNLLILEASLRLQYLTLRARRRQHSFFLLLLSLWTIGFFYALFLRPREDGSGVGGSVYWVIEIGEKVALMGGVVTGILFWGTGQWDRGVRWPRRWVGTANRGLRSINAKIVVIKGPWWRELMGVVSFLFPYSLFFPHHKLQYRPLAAIGKSTRRTRLDYDRPEEDLSPGGDYIKLLLLPKPFSPDFRENWELYRLEYWEKENERRAQLRRHFKDQSKRQAREEGKWLWWTGLRGHATPPDLILEDTHSTKRHQRTSGDGDHRPRGLTVRPESHSRNTSRSSTPASFESDDRPTSGRVRRGSSHNATAGERRKKVKSLGSSDYNSPSNLSPVKSEAGAAPVFLDD